MTAFIHNFLKFFFLMTPFFVLSMYLSMTLGWEIKRKRVLALRIGFAVLAITMVLFFFGRWLFDVFGITLDAFRIGGGALLFLSAVGLVNGKVEDKKGEVIEDDSDEKISNISVVPLAIPVTVGPGTTAALLLFGAETSGIMNYVLNVCALSAAAAALTLVLYIGTAIERKLGRNGILIVTKITGLILAAMAAQMIFTGIRSFLVVQ